MNILIAVFRCMEIERMLLLSKKIVKELAPDIIRQRAVVEGFFDRNVNRKTSADFSVR